MLKHRFHFSKEAGGLRPMEKIYPMIFYLQQTARRVKRQVKDFIFYTVWHAGAQVNPAPIFILGSPKSGTTAIARLLSDATEQILTADFLRAIPRLDLQARLNCGALPFETFIRQYRYEFSNALIKEPFLSFFTDDLVANFPRARFVFISRDPFQNIRSILNRLKIPGDRETIDLNDWQELKITPAWRYVLQSDGAGVKSCNYIEALARRWSLAVDHYRQYEDKFLLVRYEDFNTDKKRTIEDLARRLDFEVKQDIERVVDRQYQPKGDRTLSAQQFFGEKNYALIENITAQNAAYLGYIKS